MPEQEARALTGSIVLAADAPAALAQFHGALLGVAPHPGLSATHWRVPWPAGGWLEIYAPSRNRPRPSQQGRVALCLQRQADGPGALAVLQALISTALDLVCCPLQGITVHGDGADHQHSPRTIQLSGQGLKRRTDRTRLDGGQR